MLKYSGYLKPYEGRILSLAREGKRPAEIGRILYADGVRSPGLSEIESQRTFGGLVRHMLGRSGHLKAPRFEEKLRKKVALLKRELRDAERSLARLRAKKIEGRK